MATDSDIRTLNSLIETTIDSADGYEQAAEHAPDAELGQIFRRFASERRSVVADLRSHVVRLGGTPEDDGSLLAAAHRTFLNLKASVSSSDRKAALEEVGRGETFIAEKYETALRDDLSPDVRSAIQRAYQSIQEGANTFSQYRSRYAA